MQEQGINNEMIRLLQELIVLMKSKRMKEEEIPSNLLFKLHNMSRNNMSKVFSDCATWVDPQLVDPMLDKGIIQRVMLDNFEKYSLTFKGIAQAIETKYGKTLEEQFLKFLEFSDHEFATTEQSPLSWKEKLASLSLILMASASISSAIRLNNEANKDALNEVFEKILDCLKRFGSIGKQEEIKTTSRGEHPVSALMSRVNELTRKTNLYYKNVRDVSGYYFDIEKDGDIEKKRLFFLLKKIFGAYDPNCDYGKMYNELEQINQLHSPRFLSRSVNPMISLSILKGLREFMNQEIWHLPQQSKPSLKKQIASPRPSRGQKSKKVKTTSKSGVLTFRTKE